MSNAKKWAATVAGDTVVFGLLYGWLWLGVEGAGNLFRVIFWVITVIAFLCALGDEKVWQNAAAKSKALRTYDVATDAALIAVLAWFSHEWMAASYLIAKLAYDSAHTAEMRRRAA